MLLDALEALGEHRRAVVLVGAQAIYLHTGDADLAVAGFTTDGDLVIDPAGLEPEPNLSATLEHAGFRTGRSVGTWTKETLLGGTPAEVAIDLLVPESVGGPGRRGARLGPHGTHVARKAKGLEAALADRQLMTITALDPRDTRSYELWIAGPAALLVAKLHKIHERIDAPARRQDDKDALDVLRLLRAVPTDRLAASLEPSSPILSPATSSPRPWRFSGSYSEKPLAAVLKWRRAPPPRSSPQIPSPHPAPR
ncbi:MAG TPA: GSU2403 family nucleotidyltransferase fold protein [bacterium]|nr:GSU2403 family nucleotidyltransferase fold protein [bacterium]